MERLKVLRKRKGISRETLAASADMSAVAIWRYETGRRSPTADQLEKLAVALDVEVADFFPKAQAPLPLDFGVDAGPDMKRLGMQSIARMRAKLLEELADLWAVQLDRGQYDAGTIQAMDQAGFLLALNHTQEEEWIKEFLEADQLEQLQRAEARFEEHGEKIHSVMRRTLGDVVEMKPYFAQRDAEREEARREISGTA